MNTPFPEAVDLLTEKSQMLWICGRNSIRPLTHNEGDYDNPQKPKRDISTLANRGLFYFGLTAPFLPVLAQSSNVPFNQSRNVPY